MPGRKLSWNSTFAGLEGLRIRALVVSGEPFFDSQRERIVGLAARYRVVTIYAWREYVLAGGLMSYGTDLPASYRQAAIYAGRILKGEKPANLPVVQPTKFLMAVNAKTAKSLGFEVPPRLLASPMKSSSRDDVRYWHKADILVRAK